MGIATNKRGIERQSERVDAELVQWLSRGLKPETLTPQEIGLGRATVSTPANAVPVWAWVHYGSTALRVKAEVVGWTSTGAVAIRWPVRQQGIQRAWVWANAVVERKPGETAL